MYSLSFTGFLNNTELKIFGRHQESNKHSNSVFINIRWIFLI